jgi:hypothetical protein
VLRPFPISIASGARPDEILVRAELSHPLDAEAEVGVKDVVQAFAGLASRGGLSGTLHNPGAAPEVVVDLRWDDRRIEVAYREVAVDPGALFILVNMFHWLHRKIVPITGLSVSWPARSRIIDPYEPDFPEQWPNLSYEFQSDDEMAGDIDVEIYLARAESPETTRAIVDAMSKWLLATHRGAFANDMFAPQESAVYLGPDVMLVEPDYVVWFIDLMRTDDAALESLLNVLEWVHQRVASIRAVTFGL